MPLISIVNNPFEPFQCEKHECHIGISVLDWLNRDTPWKGWDKPTIVIVNGNAIMQAEYATTYLTKETDQVAIVSLAGYEAIYFFVILIVVSLVAAVIFAPQPPNIVNQDTKEANTVYSLDGRGNANKLGQEIPCGYGLFRNWFDRGANPYNGYKDNNQYLYLLLCAGHGESEITDLRIGNTPIENFKEVTVEIIPPYGYITLFRDSVITSSEIGALEIFAPNEAEYTGPIGPFVLNTFDEEIDRIEWDISLPKGLGKQNDNGGLSSLTVTGYVEYRQIDINGDPVEAEAVVNYSIVVREKSINAYPPVYRVHDKTTVNTPHGFPDGHKTTVSATVAGTLGRITTYYINRLTNWQRIEFAKTFKTIDPQRFTLAADVPLGRYETQFDRTSDKNLTISGFNDLFIDAARGFQPNRAYYGDKTMVAIEALATSNLNNQSAQQFNGLQQRLLETWDGTEWTGRVATRNPIWAACDACRAQYSARLSDVFLDLSALRSLAIVYDTLGITFDYLFAIKSNLWDTLKTILAVGKTIPMLNGSRITAIRDRLLTLPEHMFTPDSIKKGTFQWNMVLRKLNDYDCVEVEYTDEDSFKQETILCLLDGDTGENPEKLKLIGITDRNKAYQMGLYNRALRKYRREVVSFSTNLQGHIPSINSLIAVVHDVPRWGQSGMVLDVVGNVLTLNKEHTFEDGIQYVILLKQRTGFSSQPYFITPAASVTDTVTVTGTLIDLTRADNEQAVIYVLGEENNVTKYLRVKSLKVVDIDTIKVECVNNNNLIYDFDNEEAPEKDAIVIIGSDELPVVDLLTVLSLPNDLTQVRVSWSTAENATGYVLEYSYDDLVWTQATITNTTYHILSVLPGTIYLRVAGINFGQGSYTTWTGLVGIAVDPPFDVTGLALQYPFMGLAATIQWNAVGTASQYVIRVYRQSDDSLLSESAVTGLSFSYGTDQAIPDFAGTPERALRFEVVAENAFGQSAIPAQLEVANPLPVALTGIAATILNETTELYEVKIEWDQLVSDADIKAYTVYASPSMGFIPGSSNIIFNSIAGFTVFTILKSGGFTDYYYRVLAVDYWGEEDTNISAEQTVVLIP